MDTLNELNKIGDLKYKEYINIKTLEVDKEYKILKFERVKGKYGTQIVCELEEFKVSLPKRFIEKMDDKNIKELNKKDIKLILKEIKNIQDKEVAIINFK